MKNRSIIISSFVVAAFLAACALYFAPTQAAVSVRNEVVEAKTIEPPATANLPNGESYEPIAKNPFLVDSPWAGIHRNGYAQASTPYRGIEPGDSVEVQFRDNPGSRVSCWSILSEKYPDGSRVVWGSNSTHVFKMLVKGNQFEAVAGYRINYNNLGFNWNLAVFKNGAVIVPELNRKRFYRFSETDHNDPRSPIQLEGYWTIPDSIPGKSAQFNVSYDGRIIILTSEGYLIALKSDFSEYASFYVQPMPGDSNGHNAFPIDENGNIFLVSTKAMTSVRWDGTNFVMNWRAVYDFRGPGCEDESFNTDLWRTITGQRCTGSGTTPTLMGRGLNADKLVLAVDGHAPQNNMVAFWRGDIPADWQGIPGYDRRVAAVTALPYSTPDGLGFTQENSPTAWGYDIATAQYNGFNPRCRPLPGVQKLRWKPLTRKLDVVWATDQVQMNNVLTYSKGSGLVYGSGRRDCTYYFWGLDWQTGEVKVEIPMGNDSRFEDQGNQVTINDDRSAIFGTGPGIVRIKPN